MNSVKIALGSAIATVLLGVLAAYAFSRLRFRGREALMIAVLGVLMLPSVATITPLFIFLNQFQIDLGEVSFNLRASILGITLAVISAQLPFAIWNLKGYLDTIPKDLEEAGAVDGASQNQIFRRIVLPLAVPALAVTGFLGFLGGWTEYLTVAMFVGSSADWTLSRRPEQHGRAVRPDDELVPVRRLLDPVRPARLRRLLHLPALPDRRPGGRRRQGLIRSGLGPGGSARSPSAARAAATASNHGFRRRRITTTITSEIPIISAAGFAAPPSRSRKPRIAA